MGWILVLSGLVLCNSAASPAVVPQGRPHFPRCAQRASMNNKLIRAYKYSYIKWYQIYSDVIKWTDDFRMFTAARKHCHTVAEGPHAIPVGARRDPRRDLQRASCSKKRHWWGRSETTYVKFTMDFMDFIYDLTLAFQTHCTCFTDIMNILCVNLSTPVGFSGSNVSWVGIVEPCSQ